MTEEVEKINLDDYVATGEGATAISYTHRTRDTIAKLYHPGFEADRAKEDFLTSCTVFELGIPTPKPIRLVTDGERFGAEYELVRDKRSFSRIISQEPERLQELSLTFAEMAKKGNIRNIDLAIGDISAHPLPGLPMDTTASNFARAQSDASKEDIAAGLIKMVLQSIGSAAWLASLGSDIRDFVLIGNLSLLPQCKEVFPGLEKLYDIRFHVPKYSQYCTAIGAALDYRFSGPKGSGSV